MTVALITEADANPGEAGYLASPGARPEQVAEIRSDSGPMHSIPEPDDTLRPGVASTSRCLGNLPGTDEDPIAFGASPGRLLTLPVDLEDINVNGIPRMTAVPLSMPPLEPGARAGCQGTYYTVLLSSATSR